MNAILSRKALHEQVYNLFKTNDYSVEKMQQIATSFGQGILTDKGLDYNVKVRYNGNVGQLAHARTMGAMTQDDDVRVIFAFETCYKYSDGSEEYFFKDFIEEADLDKVTLA